MSVATIQIDQATALFVRKLVRDHAAIALDETKDYLIHSRLLPVARRHGLSSIRELVSQLRGLPIGDLHLQVVEALTTTETSFFRDVHAFEALKNDLLPALITARNTTRALNIWSAACSTGQEPYSIAILLAEHFPRLANWNIQVLASDFGRQVLTRAARGEYSQRELGRGLTPELIARFFEPHGARWRVRPGIRQQVKFTRINLIEAWPAMPKLDIVLLRNVLIYFAADAKRQILNEVKTRLADDGVLILGGAETTLGIDDDWQRVSHGKSSSYRLCRQNGL